MSPILRFIVLDPAGARYAGTVRTPVACLSKKDRASFDQEPGPSFGLAATENSTAENTSTEAYCDAGDTVLSGGYNGLGTNEGLMISTRPESAGSGEEGWTVLWKNASPSLDADAQPIAVCADFPPAHIPTF